MCAVKWPNVAACAPLFQNTEIERTSSAIKEVNIKKARMAEIRKYYSNEEENVKPTIGPRRNRREIISHNFFWKNLFNMFIYFHSDTTLWILP